MKHAMRWGWMGFAAAVAATASAQVDLVALEAYASNGRGDMMTPMVGEPHFVSLRFEVRGNLRGTYRMRIECPFQKMDTPPVTFGAGSPGEYVLTWGPVPTLTARSVPFRATLVPVANVRESNRQNNAATFTLSPTLPGVGIESFGGRNLYGDMNLDVAWNSRTPAPQDVQLWLPRAASESFQTLVQAVYPLGMGTGEGEAFSAVVAPVEPTDGRLQVRQRIDTFATNQRVNPVLLGPSAIGAVDAEMAAWLRPETLIQSQHPDLVRWAAQARMLAGSDSVYAVAERLYDAVLQRVAYSRQPAAPDALATYRRRKGDCGAMSALFVALCRSQGIAARPVTGFTLGEDAWHVWAEFHVPGHGWVSVDPAYADVRTPSGGYSLYFGVNPELDARIATNFGFEKSYGDRTVPYLQAPSVFWSNAAARVTLARCSANLSLAPQP